MTDDTLRGDEPHAPDHLTDDLLAELEAVALEVATRCGRLITDERPRDLGVAATKSSATDVVTAMDTASERLARSILDERRPGDGFHGEEGGTAASTTGITWVVDPIDGTVNYLYEHPMSCVSVAACTGDPATPGGFRPVAAAVGAPVLGEVFTARRGGGARLHRLTPGLPTGHDTGRDTGSGDPSAASQTLVMAPAQDLAGTLLATGFGYRPEVREWQGRLVAGILPQVRDIRRGGSAALDLCYVAAGRLDAYAEHGLNPWDLAAGWLVVTEAGGVVTDLEGGAPCHTWTVAGGAVVVPELRAALSALGGGDVPARKG